MLQMVAVWLLVLIVVYLCIEMFLYTEFLETSNCGFRVYLEIRVSHSFILYTFFFALFLLHFFLFATDMENDNKSTSRTAFRGQPRRRQLAPHPGFGIWREHTRPSAFSPAAPRDRGMRV
jgi:hypothetical protein